MRYEEPNMRVLMLEAEDIITLSNVGEAGEQDDQEVGNNTPAGGEW